MLVTPSRTPHCCTQTFGRDAGAAALARPLAPRMPAGCGGKELFSAATNVAGDHSDGSGAVDAGRSVKHLAFRASLSMRPRKGWNRWRMAALVRSHCYGLRRAKPPWIGCV